MATYTTLSFESIDIVAFQQGVNNLLEGYDAADVLSMDIGLMRTGATVYKAAQITVRNSDFNVPIPNPDRYYFYAYQDISLLNMRTGLNAILGAQPYQLVKEVKMAVAISGASRSYLGAVLSKFPII